MEERKYDLEERLIEFSCMVIDVVELLGNSRAANYIAGHLIRCGIAPALLYGEAQAAESRDDFIHKLKVCLKELKETRVCLRIIVRKELVKPIAKVTEVLIENEELIAIVGKSIETARRNNKSGQNT
jgi:four helix bundle protein